DSAAIGDGDRFHLESGQDARRAHFLAFHRSPRYDERTPGSVWASREVPEKITDPAASTTHCSVTPKATFMLCSTKRMETPISSIGGSSFSNLSISVGERPDAGSSSRTTLGAVASARARSTS